MLAQVSDTVRADPVVGPAGVGPETLRRIELDSGGLAGAGVAAMAERLPWFARLTADQRAGVLLVTQTGAANFATWLRDPAAAPRLTAEAFRNAPPDLARRVTLRQTVELVRIALEVFDHRIPELADGPEERAALIRAVLHFGREVAFAAATVYASAAESRGAWDARLEALVVDAVVRGDAEEALLSRAAALGWDPAAAAVVLVGDPPHPSHAAPPDPLQAARRAAHRAGASVLLGAHGARLVMVLAGDADPGRLHALGAAFGPGPVVTGPAVAGLVDAHRSAEHALAGLRAVPAWPGAPRPVTAGALLPERVLAGDPSAVEQVLRGVAAPLREAGGALVETVEAYLDAGGVVEACDRWLFVHANTVRYRLRRVAELTGHHPADPRSALVVRIAVALDRLRVTPGPVPPP